MGNYPGCIELPDAHHVLFSEGTLGMSIGVCVPKSCRPKDYIKHLNCMDSEINNTMQQLIGTNANLSKAIAQAANFITKDYDNGYSGESGA